MFDLEIAKRRIVGKGTGWINPKIEDVSLVDGMKFNLISLRQLCDKGMKVTFEKTHCDVVKQAIENTSIFKAKQKENTCVVNFAKIQKEKDVCLASLVGDKTSKNLVKGWKI